VKGGGGDIPRPKVRLPPLAVPVAGSGPLGELFGLITKWAEQAADQLESPKREKLQLAANVLKEHLHRLDVRHLAVSRSERRCRRKRVGKRQILDFQLDLVDKLEAFHQGVYSTIAALLLFLSHAAPREKVRDLPIKSVKRALELFESLSVSPLVKEAVRTLRSSNEFRTQFADHPQMHALHNWLTFTFHAQAIVLFFKPDFFSERSEDERRVWQWLETRIMSSGARTPWDPAFLADADPGRFYIAPPARATSYALSVLVRSVLVNWIPGAADIAAHEWETAFPARGLSEIVAECASMVDPTSRVTLCPFQLPVRSAVSFSGRSRPVTEEVRDLVEAHYAAFFQSGHLARLVQREYSFTEGAAEFWIPVDAANAEHLDSLREGDRITVFALCVGTIGVETARRWIFLATGFRPGNTVGDS